MADDASCNKNSVHRKPLQESNHDSKIEAAPNATLEETCANSGEGSANIDPNALNPFEIAESLWNYFERTLHVSTKIKNKVGHVVSQIPDFENTQASIISDTDSNLKHTPEISSNQNVSMLDNWNELPDTKLHEVADDIEDLHDSLKCFIGRRSTNPELEITGKIRSSYDSQVTPPGDFVDLETTHEQPEFETIRETEVFSLRENNYFDKQKILHGHNLETLSKVVSSEGPFEVTNETDQLGKAPEAIDFNIIKKCVAMCDISEQHVNELDKPVRTLKGNMGNMGERSAETPHISIEEASSFEQMLGEKEPQWKMPAVVTDDPVCGLVIVPEQKASETLKSKCPPEGIHFSEGFINEYFQLFEAMKFVVETQRTYINGAVCLMDVSQPEEKERSEEHHVFEIIGNLPRGLNNSCHDMTPGKCPKSFLIQSSGGPEISKGITERDKWCDQPTYKTESVGDSHIKNIEYNENVIELARLESTNFKTVLHKATYNMQEYSVIKDVVSQIFTDATDFVEMAVLSSENESNTTFTCSDEKTRPFDTERTNEQLLNKANESDFTLNLAKFIQNNTTGLAVYDSSSIEGRDLLADNCEDVYLENVGKTEEGKYRSVNVVNAYNYLINSSEHVNNGILPKTTHLEEPREEEEEEERELARRARNIEICSDSVVKGKEDLYEIPAQEASKVVGETEYRNKYSSTVIDKPQVRQGNKSSDGNQGILTCLHKNTNGTSQETGEHVADHNMSGGSLSSPSLRSRLLEVEREATVNLSNKQDIFENAGRDKNDVDLSLSKQGLQLQRENHPHLGGFSDGNTVSNNLTEADGKEIESLSTRQDNLETVKVSPRKWTNGEPNVDANNIATSQPSFTPDDASFSHNEEMHPLEESLQFYFRPRLNGLASVSRNKAAKHCDAPIAPQFVKQEHLSLTEELESLSNLYSTPSQKLSLDNAIVSPACTKNESRADIRNALIQNYNDISDVPNSSDNSLSRRPTHSQFNESAVTSDGVENSTQLEGGISSEKVSTTFVNNKVCDSTNESFLEYSSTYVDCCNSYLWENVSLWEHSDGAQMFSTAMPAETSKLDTEERDESNGSLKDAKSQTATIPVHFRQPYGIMEDAESSNITSRREKSRTRPEKRTLWKIIGQFLGFN